MEKKEEGNQMVTVASASVLNILVVLSFTTNARHQTTPFILSNLFLKLAHGISLVPLPHVPLLTVYVKHV